jgi:pyruvate formate lyase activating enzyme
VRENRDGKLWSLVYGRVIAHDVDPIEKKPLFHFHPGSLAYSITTPGCNFHCRFCQNWQISQLLRESERNGWGAAARAYEDDRSLLALGDEMRPEDIVAAARRAGCGSIAYTYTEPTIFFEYSYDTARLARAAGITNVYVTNGYMTAEMLDLFHPYLDAANVDLKSFRDQTYRKVMGARLAPVLDTLRLMKRLGIWLEVTTLVIPGLNDSAAEIRDVARFLARECGADTPWHVSGFFPAYRMADVPPTPPETLRRARDIGLEEGLRYVYEGNLWEGGDEDTRCRECRVALIRRRGFDVLENRVARGRCPDCGATVAGVGRAFEDARGGRVEGRPA